MALLMKLPKQFEPAHPRQIGVDQQACGLAGIKGFKKGLAARVGINRMPRVFEHCTYRLANLVVIIDHDYPGAARSPRGVSSLTRRHDLLLDGLASSFLIARIRSVNLTGLLR